MLTHILKKTLISIFLFSFLVSPVNFFCSTPIKVEDKKDDIAVGLFAFGAGILGGIGLSGLFTSKSDKEIIEGSINALKVANQYNDKLKILEKNFNLSKNLKNGNKLIINEINEEINYDLASIGLIINNDFMSSLSNLISDLKFYQNKIPKRINKLNYKLRRNKNNSEYIETISNLEKQQLPISNILPKLEFLKSYIDARYKYFQTYNLLISLSAIYDKEISNLEKHDEAALSSELTRCARIKFSENSLYPCIKFIEQIDNDIYSIEQRVRKLPNYYKDLIADANELIEFLKEIRLAVIGDKEYLQERRDWNNQYSPKTFFGLSYTIC